MVTAKRLDGRTIYRRWARGWDMAGLARHYSVPAWRIENILRQRLTRKRRKRDAGRDGETRKEEA